MEKGEGEKWLYVKMKGKCAITRQSRAISHVCFDTSSVVTVKKVKV